MTLPTTEEIAIIADVTICERCDDYSMTDHERGKYEDMGRRLHMRRRMTTRAGIRRIGELLYPGDVGAYAMWYYVWQRSVWINDWAERYLRVRLGRRVFKTNRVYVLYLLSRHDPYGMPSGEPIEGMSDMQRKAWAWAR